MELTKTAITGKYGDPALAAVTSTGGHMVETFVYSRNRGRNATVIRLEDGKVAAAYSQAEPFVPPGLSAPRRYTSSVARSSITKIDPPKTVPPQI